MGELYVKIGGLFKKNKLKTPFRHQDTRSQRFHKVLISNCVYVCLVKFSVFEPLWQNNTDFIT